GQTLDKETDFQAFSSTFSKTRSVFAYLNMPRYFSDLRGLLSPAKWQSAKYNRSYILCFPQIGFHFKAEEGGFRTRFSADFRKPGEQDLIVPELQPLDVDSMEALDSLSDVDQFMIEHINGNVMREYYDNGQLKFIAEVKDNIFHGKYLEYWENGMVKVKGKYRDGQKTGRWRFFNAEGVLERRERFGRDKETDPEPLL
ncbi:MAG: toxin-antitoxin system YwqK family antitoxin, partial [Bacteroidota bacterium]